MSRLLALDVGERRIGVAVSDPTEMLAQPLLVIDRRGWAADLARIRDLVSAHQVTRIVVGYPYTLRKTRGLQAQQVDRFVARLRQAVTVEVLPYDERLTTAQAERALLAGNVRRARRRSVRDAVAAALLLQNYLDRQRARSL